MDASLMNHMEELEDQSAAGIRCMLRAIESWSS